MAGRPTARADPAVVGRRLVDHADHGDPRMRKRDQRAIDRGARDVRGCPVDGIEDPDELGVRILRLPFLAEDPVRRITIGDHGAQSSLDLDIEGGDEAAVCLDRRLRTPPARRREHGMRGIGEFRREGDEVVQLMVRNLVVLHAEIRSGSHFRFDFMTLLCHLCCCHVGEAVARAPCGGF